MKLSVVIPYYNSQSTIIRCIESLIKQKKYIQEIIIIDDCSPIKVKNILDNEIANNSIIKIIRLNKNQGPANARNIGAASATQQFILFIDADVEINQDGCEQITHIFKNTNKKIAAVCGVYSLPEKTDKINIATKFKLLQDIYFRESANKYINHFLTSIGAIKKKIFLKYGGFNTKFKNALVEEAELGNKLSKNNKLIYLNKNIKGKHLSRITIFKLLKIIIYRTFYFVNNSLSTKTIYQSITPVERLISIFMLLTGILLLTIDQNILSIIFFSSFIILDYKFHYIAITKTKLKFIFTFYFMYIIFGSISLIVTFLTFIFHYFNFKTFFKSHYE